MLFQGEVYKSKHPDLEGNVIRVIAENNRVPCSKGTHQNKQMKWTSSNSIANV